MKQKRLNRAVIKEELVELTGHFVQALILDQFISWSERTRDFDQLQEDRKLYTESDIESPPLGGWVYKSPTELSVDLMLKMEPNTIRGHMVKLIDAGYLKERPNPKSTWAKTKQYKPNMVKIQTGLQDLGCSLEGYSIYQK